MSIATQSFHGPTRRETVGYGDLLARNPELQIHQDAYNINVTANFGELLSREATAAAYREHRGAGEAAHLYFHVPLCSYVCHFCNYVKRKMSERLADETLDRWTGLLLGESERSLRSSPWVADARIESMFLGGGTASLLRERHLRRLLDHVKAHYSLAPGCEITLEGNPDDFCGGEAELAQALGFNRFSVGVQSLDTRVNRFAGREHDREMSLQAIERLLATGLPFNVDIMFGLPYQTISGVADDLETLVSLRVPTLTIYRFRNVERHKMGIGNRSSWNVPKVRDRLEAEGLFPSLEATYAMREVIVDTLLGAGYFPSPCGWWSRPGTYPDGNIPRVSRNKWQRYDTMIAYGPGAYGWLTGGREDVVQTHNIADISAYVRHMETDSETLPLSTGRKLKGYQALATQLGFALKANQPISLATYRRRYDIDLLNDPMTAAPLLELAERRLLAVDGAGSTLRLTLEGEALHEEIISVYVHGRIGGSAHGTCRRHA